MIHRITSTRRSSTYLGSSGSIGSRSCPLRHSFTPPFVHLNPLCSPNSSLTGGSQTKDRGHDRHGDDKSRSRWGPELELLDFRERPGGLLFAAAPGGM